MIEQLVRPDIYEKELSSRFTRLVIYDLCLSDYLTALNLKEEAYSPDYAQAITFTANLIRKSLFHTFRDILDYGSTALLKTSVETLEVIRLYTEGKIPSMIAEGNASVASTNIDNFIKAQLSRHNPYDPFSSG